MSDGDVIPKQKNDPKAGEGGGDKVTGRKRLYSSEAEVKKKYLNKLPKQEKRGREREGAETGGSRTAQSQG